MPIHFLRRALLIIARARSIFISDRAVQDLEVKDVRVYTDLEGVDPRRLGELVSLYKELYGELDAEAGSVWGEGAYCSKEGKLKKICLDEYEARKRSGRVGCACGGVFVPFYEDGFVEGRVRSAFKLADGTEIPGCLSLMTEQDRIVGFAWGSLLGGAQINGKINESVPRKLSPEDERHLNRAFAPGKTYFYFDEIAIQKRARRGLQPILGLFLSTLKRPFGAGVTDIVFWTERGSRIHRFGVELGFREVHDLGHGVVMTSSGLPTFMKLIYQYLDRPARSWPLVPARSSAAASGAEAPPGTPSLSPLFARPSAAEDRTSQVGSAMIPPAFVAATEAAPDHMPRPRSSRSSVS